MSSWKDDPIASPDDFPKESEEERKRRDRLSLRTARENPEEYADSNAEIARLLAKVGESQQPENEWDQDPAMTDWEQDPPVEEQPLSRAESSAQQAMGLMTDAAGWGEAALKVPSSIYGGVEWLVAGATGLGQMALHGAGSLGESLLSRIPFMDRAAKDLMNIGADAAFQFRATQATSPREQENLIAERELKRKEIDAAVDRMRILSAKPLWEHFNEEFQSNMEATQGIAGRVNDVFERLNPDTDTGKFLLHWTGTLTEEALDAVGWGTTRFAQSLGATPEAAAAGGALMKGELAIGALLVPGFAGRAGRVRRQRLIEEQKAKDLADNPDQYLQKYYPETWINLQAARHGKVEMGMPGGVETNVRANIANTLESLGVAKEAFEGKTIKEMTILAIETVDRRGEISSPTRTAIGEALARQIDELARVEASREIKRLSAPSAVPGVIEVTPGGIAATAAQRAAGRDVFDRLSNEQRAEVLGIGPMGRLRTQAEALKRAQRDAATAPESEVPARTSGARDALETSWAQAFPLGKAKPGVSRAQRAQVLQEWISEGMPYHSWENLAARVYARPKRPEARAGGREAGVVEIEGLPDLADVSFAVFSRLPTGAMLSRRQIEEVVKQPDIRGGERATVGRVLRQFEGDRIPSRAFAEAMGREAVPVRLEPNRSFASYGHNFIKPPSGRASDFTFVARAPFKTGALNDFGVPEYLGHLRGFRDKAQPELTYITELQSSLFQKKRMPEEAPPSVADMKKGWHERILREISREVARGVKEGNEASLGRTLRLPLGETAATIQGWPRGAKAGFTFELKDPFSDIYHFAEGRKVEVKYLDTPTFKGYVAADVGINEKTLGKDYPRFQETVQKIPPDALPEQVRGLFDFYDKDLRTFVEKEWGAKEVLDEKGNKWMEWTPDVVTATERVPMFGPLQSRGKAGGRQAGVVEIPDLPELPKTGKEALEQAARQAPGVAVGDSARAKQVEAQWAAAERFRQAQQLNTLKRLQASFRDHVADHQGTLKRTLIEKGGEMGREVVDRLNVISGSVMKGKYIYEQQAKPIFDSLTPEEFSALNKLVSARNMIEARRRNPKYKGRDGFTPEAMESWIKIEAKRDPQGFAKIEKAADKVFQVYRGQLRELVKEGLMSEDEFGRAVRADTVSDITRILDPELEGVGSLVSGKPETSSGIPYMRTTKAMIDSRELLSEVIGRTQNRIMRNQAAGALYSLAEMNPDLGFVRTYPVAKRGKTGKAEGVYIPEGFRKINFWKEGEEHVLLMDELLGEQWYHRPPALDTIVENIFRLVSGTSLVKALATSYNPLFVTSGLPMDAFHVYLAGQGYSPHLPIFMGEFAVDMLTTASDAITRGPRFQKALMEGMGFDFMTHQGRDFFTSRSSLERQFNPKWDKAKKFLSWVNETAEINVRLAHRDRLIKEGMPSWQATARARDRLDYSQGGTLSKAADTLIPYSNVAIQGWRSVLREMNRDRAAAAAKLTWTTSAIAGVVYLNILQDPEAWKDIPARDKIMGIPIIVPELTFIDSAGNRRVGYVNLRTDNVMAPLHALTVAVMEKAMFGETVTNDVIRESLSQLPSLLQVGTWPIPALEAWHRYASNFDVRADSPIWTGAKLPPEFEFRGPASQRPTSELAKSFGSLLGASPERLESATRALVPNNPYIGGIGKLAEIAVGTVGDPSVRSKGAMEILAQNSTARRVVKFTHPAHRELEAVDKAVREQGGKLKQVYDTTDEYVVKYGQGEATEKDFAAWLTTQAPELQERLGKRFKTGAAIEHVMKQGEASVGVPSRSWWMGTANVDAEVRAQLFFSEWVSADAPERKRMESIAGGLSKFGIGYASDDFKRHLGRLRQQFGEDLR